MRLVRERPCRAEGARRTRIIAPARLVGLALLVLGLGAGQAGAAIAPPPTGTTWVGVSAPRLAPDVAQFASDARHAMGLVQYYGDWRSGFDTGVADAVRANGATPILSWEPWDNRNGSASQTAYSLRQIAGGRYDSYIRRWATAVRAWGHPLFVRFAHEMNGNWYPWDEGVNGNRSGEYVRAWRHVHDVVVAAGAQNVSWIWCVNTLYTGSTPLAGLYPGDAYVDWIGVDADNFGTIKPAGGWLTFRQLFDPVYSQLRTLTSRPLLINETASTEAGGNKAGWITDLFAELHANPAIRGFLWFNFNKETDWRIESSPAAQSAFASGIARLTITSPAP